jgi:hypothetical protein
MTTFGSRTSVIGETSRLAQKFGSRTSVIGETSAQNSVQRRTISTFSCDIARSVSRSAVIGLV